MAKKTKQQLLGDATPTQAQIDKVRVNLNNLIQLNSDVLYGGNMRIDNAFLKLSLQDSKDLGLQIGLNLLCGGFWAAAAVDSGGLAALAANFCSGVVSHYANETPPSLAGQTSQLIIRFQNTSMQLQHDLQTFYADPVTYWNKQYSGTFSDAFGTYNVSGSLSDLANCDVPAKTDPEYTQVELLCLKGVDQQTWNVLLPNFVITEYYPQMEFSAKQYNDQSMIKWCNGFDENNTSYWCTYKYEQAKGIFGGDKSAYWLNQWNIGTGWVPFGDGHLSSDACNYLFCDLNDSTPNPAAINGGLFSRTFVFTKMPKIKQTSHTYSYATRYGNYFNRLKNLFKLNR